jgi:hypothetical protein
LHIFFRLLLPILLVSCVSDPSPTDTAPASPPKAKTSTPVPKFDRDSAYAYVAKQVEFGPRVVNTDAHRRTKEWLVDKLQSFGAEVREQDFEAKAFDGTILSATNIIARFQPEREDRILLTAHWDTRPFADSELEDDPDAVVMGADDGASGAGVLLEIARQLSQHEPNIGVDIVLLDAEDYGKSGGGNRNSWALGAQYYAKNIRAPKPEFGILLDMVGARGATFAQEGYSRQYAPELLRKVWRLAKSMGYGEYFVDRKAGPVLDDHYFINSIANIPTIDIINLPQGGKSSFVDHWHTGDDNLDKIDKRTLRAAGQVVLAAVFRAGDGTL